MVKTCNDPQPQETCTIVAVGVSVPLPIMIPGMDAEQFEKDGGFIVNTREPIAPAGKPLPQDIQRSLNNPQWSVSKAATGEEVTLSVSLTNQYENANVFFSIWEEGADREKDVPVKKLSAPNKGGKTEAKWRYVYIHDPDHPLTAKPKFVFTVKSYRCAQVESGSIEIGMDLKAVCRDTTGDLLANLPYYLIKNGKNEKQEKTDSNGIIEKENVIPGQAILFDFKDYRKGEENKTETSELLSENVEIKKQRLKGDDFISGKCTYPDFINEIIIPTLVLRLNINPLNRDNADDKYKLYSKTPEIEYECTQTVSDDKIANDNFLDLHFVGINPGALYSLEIDMGEAGIKYHLFKNLSVENL